jgi:predicted ATP-dependent endonuclease of OLD family
MDVSIRKGHQIVITTHSEDILKALPSESRILLKNNGNGVVAIPGLTALQSRSIMSEGHTKSLWILVEDECAKIVLTEIVRRIDPTFLSTIEICVGGDEDQLDKAALALKKTGLPIAIVKDGDMAERRADSIFKLLGTQPPEKELLACQEVKNKILSDYQLSLDDFAITLTGINHHDWWKCIAEKIQIDEKALLTIASKEYTIALNMNDCKSLVDGLKDCAH